MQTLTDMLFKSGLRDVVTDIDVENLLGGATPARRHALVKRALARGELVRIRRGLYLLAAPYRKRPVDLYTLACRVYQPAYVSCESALAHHGFIPERVSVVTCSAFRRAATFETPVGRFTYYHTPFSDLTSVQRVASDADRVFLIASPLRAVADLVHAQRGFPASADFLRQSLRIDVAKLIEGRHGELSLLAGLLAPGRARSLLLDVQKERRV
jgi:hypothetical protein